jgi:hypothetical protein
MYRIPSDTNDAWCEVVAAKHIDVAFSVDRENGSGQRQPRAASNFAS